MREIRIHGRGGQGAVLAAELLAVAAFEDGKFGQAFPAFGGERRGAPVQAFVRLDAGPVRVRYRVNEPDYVIILDRTLPGLVDVLAGLKPGGLALIDGDRSPWPTDGSPADPAGTMAQGPADADAGVLAVPATRIAQDVFGQPLVNPVMLGALAAATGEVSLGALQQAYLRRFPGPLGDQNSRAVRMGYDFIRPAGSPPAVPLRLRRPERPGSPGTAPSAARSPGSGRSSPQQGPVAGAEPGRPGRPLHFALVVAPRTVLGYPTGSWRYIRPLVERRNLQRLRPLPAPVPRRQPEDRCRAGRRGLRLLQRLRHLRRRMCGGAIRMARE